MKSQIISEKVLNLGEVKDLIHKVKRRDMDLNFRAQKTLDYIDEVVKISPANAKKLSEEITNLKVHLLREQHIQKIVSVLPTTPEDVKVVMQGFSLNVTKENLQKIADTVKPFVTD